MTKRKTISLTKLLIFECVILTLVSFFIFRMEARVTETERKEEMIQKITLIKSSYFSAIESSKHIEDFYTQLLSSEVKSIAYLADHVEGFELSERLTHFFSNPEIVINPEDTDRKDYQTAQSQDGTTYALEKVPDVIFDTAYDECFRLAINQNILSKQDLFIITSEDGKIVYSTSDGDMHPKTVSDLGFKMSDLKMEDSVNIKINGTKYYTAASKDADNGLVYICALKSHTFNINNRITSAIICAAMWIIVTIVVTYTYFSRQEDEEDPQAALDSVRNNPWIYGIIGLIVMVLVTFHIQSLFAMSIFSMNADYKLSTINSTIEQSLNRVSAEIMVNRHVDTEKAASINNILSLYPELQTDENLIDLKDIYQVSFIQILDSNRNELQSTTQYKGEFQDYEQSLISIINGSDSYLVSAKEEIDGMFKDIELVIDNPISNQENNDQFVAVGLPFDNYLMLSNFLTVDSVLDSIPAQKDDETVCIDPESKRVVYSSLDGYVNSSSANMGFSDASLTTDCVDQIRIDDARYYFASDKIYNNLYFQLEKAHSIFEGRTQIVVTVTIIYAISAAVILLMLGRYEVTPLKKDGEDKSSLSPFWKKAFSFFDFEQDWFAQSAEEKAFFIAQTIFHVLSFIVIGIVLFRNAFYNDSTIFGFIVNARWDKGFNLFSITAVVVTCFVYSLIISVVRFVFGKLISLSDQKNETILRLMRSFLIYGTMIGLLFYCLYLMGMDPASLLASAGLAGFVISMGAKDLITDILAGLFIIFENQFHVGDIIAVGPDIGTVVEIGVRTTRIKSSRGDIICIGNRNLSNVINKTKNDTFTGILLSVNYSQNIPAIEDMLKAELPKLHNLDPQIVDGPVYSGILDFTDRYVRMVINFSSKETERTRVYALISTELCRLFDEHGFTMGTKPIEYRK